MFLDKRRSGFIHVFEPNGCDVGQSRELRITFMHESAALYSTVMHFLASYRHCDIPSTLHLLWRERTLARSEQQMNTGWTQLNIF